MLNKNEPHSRLKDSYKERYWDIEKNIMLVHCENAKTNMQKILERDGLKREVIVDKTISYKWCPICKYMKNIEESDL
jgi:hypothetical protein